MKSRLTLVLMGDGKFMVCWNISERAAFTVVSAGSLYPAALRAGNSSKFHTMHRRETDGGR